MDLLLHFMVLLINIEYSIDLPLLEFMYLDEGAFDNIVYVTAKGKKYDLCCS